MSNKGKLILSVTGVVISIVLIIISAFLTENALISSTLASIFTAVSVVLVIVAVFFAAKIDYETGVYECRNCGHIFTPTFKAYIWGSHTLTTRYLKCPKCEEKTWCKRKLKGE